MLATTSSLMFISLACLRPPSSAFSSVVSRMWAVAKVATVTAAGTCSPQQRWRRVRKLGWCCYFLFVALPGALMGLLVVSKKTFLRLYTVTDPSALSRQNGGSSGVAAWMEMKVAAYFYFSCFKNITNNFLDLLLFQVFKCRRLEINKHCRDSGPTVIPLAPGHGNRVRRERRGGGRRWLHQRMAIN